MVLLFERNKKYHLSIVTIKEKITNFVNGCLIQIWIL
jgi:hypothetical protein